MLFTLPVCSQCNCKIPPGHSRLHCFADECEDREKLDLCECCYLRYGHAHPVWRERVWIPADFSWRLRGATVVESLRNSFRYYSQRPCLGLRACLADGTSPFQRCTMLLLVLTSCVAHSGGLGKFQWLTFGEVAARSKHVGRGLQLLGLQPVVTLFFLFSFLSI